MTDSVLIQHGKAHEIWRGKDKSELPPMHPDIVAQIVEVTSDTVNQSDIWDGRKFTKPVVVVEETGPSVEDEIAALKIRVDTLEGR